MKMESCRNKGPVAKEELVNLYYENNLTSLEIATKLHRSKTTILYWMRKYKLKRRDLSEAKKGRKPVLSEAWRRNRRLKYSGKNNPMWGKFEKDHPAWKPPEKRKTCFYDNIRSMKELKNWRKMILEKGNHVCLFCSSTENLNVDHIKPFALILKEYGVDTREKARKCKELFSLENGRILCQTCHKKPSSYGKRL